MNDNVTTGIDDRAAELLALQLNRALTNACSYGSDHPMTVKACEATCDHLVGALESCPHLSLLVDRGALFIEKHPVGNRFNPRRMLNTFGRAGLESITFNSGMTSTDLQGLIHILARLEALGDVEQARRMLAERQVAHIQLNHIVYRQVRADEAVVHVDHGLEPAERPETAFQPAPGGSLPAALDAFMSLKQMMEHPDLAAGHPAGATKGSDEAAQTRMIQHLKAITREIERGGTVSSINLSSAEILKAMNSLRLRIQDSIGSHGDGSRSATTEKAVVSEIDQLTCTTLVSLVREEYRDGQFSASRMAQIINRMLPGSRDLEPLLPQIRAGLLEEGMPESEYNELVHRLASERHDERIVDGLEKGAASIGLDVDEAEARLPARVLTTATTAMFLKREVMTARRYKTAFSVAKVLIERLIPGQGAPRRPSRSELGQVLPGLYQRLIELARELDLIGSLEKSQRAIPFLILPMTDQEGANIFRSRLAESLRTTDFSLGTEKVRIEATITAVGYDPMSSEGAGGFLERVNRLQKANRRK